MKMESKPGPGKKRLEAILEGLADVHAEVGWFPSARYPDGTSVAHVAAIQEFGHGPIPPRPFMRPTLTGKASSWKILLDQQVKTLPTGGNMVKVMTVVAATVEGDIAKAITAVKSPPLKQSTIDKRFHSKKGNVSIKPLVDTRLMFDTLTSVVEKKQ